jgi:hypothetical protein
MTITGDGPHKTVKLEAGESFTIETPAGKLSVEQTQDTFDIVCEDGFVAFSAEKESFFEKGDEAKWIRLTPPTE